MGRQESGEENVNLKPDPLDPEFADNMREGTDRFVTEKQKEVAAEAWMEEKTVQTPRQCFASMA